MMAEGAVLASAAFVSRQAASVHIDDSAVTRVAEKLARVIRQGNYHNPYQRWHQHPLNPTSLTATTVDWIFICDLLNFSFWTDDNTCPYGVRFAGRTYTGYWSLCAALNRALAEGIPVVDPRWLAQASSAELARIFRSDSGGTIPLLNERIFLLQQAGLLLTSKYGGSFVGCLEASGYNVQSLLNLVCSDFPSFLDVAWYRGQTGSRNTAKGTNPRICY